MILNIFNSFQFLFSPVLKFMLLLNNTNEFSGVFSPSCFIINMQQVIKIQIKEKFRQARSYEKS